MAVSKKAKKTGIEKHILIPKHSLCTDKEKEQVFEKFNATALTLPKISSTDPAIQSLKAKVGDVIKVERTDEYVGKTLFYRVVTNE